MDGCLGTRVKEPRILRTPSTTSKHLPCGDAWILLQSLYGNSYLARALFTSKYFHDPGWCRTERLARDLAARDDGFMIVIEAGSGVKGVGAFYAFLGLELQSVRVQGFRGFGF